MPSVHDWFAELISPVRRRAKQFRVVLRLCTMSWPDNADILLSELLALGDIRRSEYGAPENLVRSLFRRRVVAGTAHRCKRSVHGIDHATVLVRRNGEFRILRLNVAREAEVLLDDPRSKNCGDYIRFVPYRMIREPHLYTKPRLHVGDARKVQAGAGTPDTRCST